MRTRGIPVLELTAVLALAIAAGCAKPSAELHTDDPTNTTEHGSGSAAIVWPPEAQASGRLSAERVCDHVIDLMQRELGPEVGISEQEFAELRTNCVGEARQERAAVGEDEFNRQAECVLAAKRLDDLAACDPDTNAASAGGPSSREVCVHVMDVMKREFEQIQTASSPSEAELAQFIDECVVELDNERAQLDAAMFEAQVACVMVARSMEDLIACEESQP